MRETNAIQFWFERWDFSLLCLEGGRLLAASKSADTLAIFVIGTHGDVWAQQMIDC